MAGLFAKAAKKTESTATKKPKVQTLWRVSNRDDEKRVSEAIHTLHELNAEAKRIEAKMGLAKTVVKQHAETKFVNDLVLVGGMPETPMIVQNDAGESCTFVVQDRSGQAKVSADQLSTLEQLLGADAVKQMVYEETSFGFDRTLLGVPGVMTAIESALVAAFGQLQESGVLSEEQVGELLTCETKTAFRSGVVDRLPQICGRDVGRVEAALEAIGSASVRYVKV